MTSLLRRHFASCETAERHQTDKCVYGTMVDKLVLFLRAKLTGEVEELRICGGQLLSLIVDVTNERRQPSPRKLGPTFTRCTTKECYHTTELLFHQHEINAICRFFVFLFLPSVCVKNKFLFCGEIENTSHK